MVSKPKISVIVTIYNNGDVLEKCLKSIRGQTFKDFELIVVDESSKDNGPAIAKKYADRFINQGIERCQQRNAGADNAKTDYLLFVDPDMELPPRILNEISDLLDSGKLIMIPEVSFGKGFWAKCKNFERAMYRGGNIAQLPRVFPKKIFDVAGGFDDKMVGTEDLDLFYRIMRKNKNLKLIETKNVIHHNEGRLTYYKIVKRMVVFSKSLKEYKRRYPRMLRKQMSPLRYISNLNHFIKHPILTMGFVIMKGSEWFTIFIFTRH